MSIKLKILLAVIAATTLFALGRYTTPTKTVIQTKIVYQDVKTDDKTTNDNHHKKTTTTEVDKPDGTKTTTTVITDDDQTNVVDKSTDTVNQTTEKTKTVTSGSDKTTVLVLGSTLLNNPTSIDYGLSVSKPILGPISIGISAYQSSRISVGLGLTF